MWEPAYHKVRREWIGYPWSERRVLLHYSVKASVEPDYVCQWWAGRRPSHPARVPVAQQGPQSPLKRAPIEGDTDDVEEPAARKPEGTEVILYSNRSRPFDGAGWA